MKSKDWHFYDCMLAISVHPSKHKKVTLNHIIFYNALYGDTNFVDRRIFFIEDSYNDNNNINDDDEVVLV